MAINSEIVRGHVLGQVNTVKDRSDLGGKLLMSLLTILTCFKSDCGVQAVR
jgi:hypothetical protein